MARVQFVVSSFVGPTDSSSLPKYQFFDYIVSEHSTTILARMPISEACIPEHTDIMTPPGNRYLRTLLFPLFVAFFLIIHRNETDIIASDRSGDAILPIVATRRLLSPWVIMCSDSPDGKFRHRQREDRDWGIAEIHERVMDRIAWHGYRNADAVVLSDKSKYIHEDKKHVIKGGVDCEAVEQVISESKNQANNDRIKVLYVGNMYYHRGVDVLFDAVRQCDSDIELVLIGPSPEAGGDRVLSEFQNHIGPSVEEVINEIEVTARYEGRLSHHETLKEMINADIGICLLPFSRGVPQVLESYPIKLFEYMYTETAVVATRTPTTEELLDDQQLVPTEESEQVANSIDRFAIEENLLKECKLRNRNKAEPHCWDSLCDDIDEIFTELAEN